jgi:hypothetical protein
MIEPIKRRPGSYGLRTLLALMTGAAFIAFVVHWLISIGGAGPPIRLVLLVAPWAIGSFAGIAIAARRNGSALVGAIAGGTLATFICPGLVWIFLYLNEMIGVVSLLDTLGCDLAFAACGSGLLAAFVDIPRSGFTLRRVGRQVRP